MADGSTHPTTVPDLAHFIALEREYDERRVEISLREMARSSGVCWSGMGGEPYQRRSEAELLAAATKRQAALVAHRAAGSPSLFGRV